MSIMESKYLELCAKAVSGDISTNEQKKLNQWLAISSKNKNIYDAMEKTWLKTESTSIPFNFDIDTEWIQLENVIERVSTKREISPLSRFAEFFKKSFIITQPRFRYAILSFASILILFSLFLWKSSYLEQDFQEIITQNKENVQVTLPDGSIVRLNAASMLQFKKEFSGEQREVTLTGEAFFTVIPDSKPFIVLTDNAKTKVIGTEFNVRTRNNLTSVIVKNGCVNLSSLKDNKKNVVLSKGQMSKISGDIPPQKPENVDVDFLLGWLDNKLVFEKTPISEIISELERYYDVKIEVKDQNLNQRTITATFENLPIEEVLLYICMTQNTQYKFESERYIIAN